MRARAILASLLLVASAGGASTALPDRICDGKGWDDGFAARPLPLRDAPGQP